MKKKKVIILLSLLLSLFVIGSAIAVSLYRAANSDAIANEGDIYIHTGSDYNDLLSTLRAGDNLKSISRFEKIAKMYDLPEKVRPGHYRLAAGTGYLQLVRMFAQGLQTPVRLTFNNVRTLPQLAGRVSGQIEPDSVTLNNHLTSTEVARSYGFNENTFIAMFIPDTYEVYWTMTPEGFTDRMKKEYDRFWSEDRREKLSALGMTETEVITLASIVYEETKMSDEMPTVAGVYINRLKRGMKLEADPTVKYAYGDFTLKRVLFKHLEVDSPYNTYKYAGLPPGPICMPSVTAIDAVLDYKRHDYLFFCAKADFSGYHSFARTLSEHNRNRALWVQALNRAGIR